MFLILDISVLPLDLVNIQSSCNLLSSPSSPPESFGLGSRGFISRSSPLPPPPWLSVLLLFRCASNVVGDPETTFSLGAARKKAFLPLSHFRGSAKVNRGGDGGDGGSVRRPKAVASPKRRRTSERSRVKRRAKGRWGKKRSFAPFAAAPPPPPGCEGKRWCWVGLANEVNWAGEGRGQARGRGKGPTFFCLLIFLLFFSVRWEGEEVE